MLLPVTFILSLCAFTIIESNSTYHNPILPGFHPDPSCIFVPSWDNTYFCASSSFLVFPGIPIHASSDLQKWKLVSNALSRPSQLPGLNTAKRATSGIWASTIRYRNGVFYVFTTIVYDDYAKNDTGRFDSFILTSKDPYSSSSWSDPIHFDFPGYDVSPFWDDDGKLYVTGTHAWEVDPGIQMISLNLKTGEVGETKNIWNGTGASAPEGPHIYRKDGYYYLLIAEGGTGSGHMATIGRSKNLKGPYESYTGNPVLTNTNTTRYFQNVGHADLFQGKRGKWWAVALSVRQGPDGSYPMGRETVLTPVTWNQGEWPIFTTVGGVMNGWHLDSLPMIPFGEGSLISSSFHSTFPPSSKIPPELVYWRFPVDGSYDVSPHGHTNTLQLTSSLANLTGHDGRSAEPLGQTFIARRQVHSHFIFSVTFDIGSLHSGEQEVGVSVFLDQLHHYDLGIVMGSPSSPPATVTSNITASITGKVVPYLRLRGITTVPEFISPDIEILQLPSKWPTKNLELQIRAENITHYILSANGRDIGAVPGLGLTWGFTGALLGVYATTNGGDGEFKTWVSDWKYIGQEEIVD